MGELTFYATIGVLVILLLKLIIETDYLGFGAYLAILLAGGMVYGAFLGKDEADDALPPAAWRQRSGPYSVLIDAPQRSQNETMPAPKGAGIVA